VNAVEVPSDYAVPSTLFDISTHSLIFRSASAIRSRNVIIDVGLCDRHLMGFSPAQTLVNLPTNAILGTFSIFGDTGVNGGGLHSRYINKL